jgi:Uma2 family endonuclease
MASATTLMTTEELLAMPDDGMERWLIRGELREKRPQEGGPPITVRNRFHSRVLMFVGHVLLGWLERQPEPRGQVLGGEAGVRLRGTPDSTVGVDVVYVAPEVVAKQTDGTTLIDGVPLLAVEILSPSDTQEEIHEKIDEYLAVGIRLVWILDPHDRTVTVYRPRARPELFNEGQELTGDPHLPGFYVFVARLFG